jgi:hypothetical protein
MITILFTIDHFNAIYTNFAEVFFHRYKEMHLHNSAINRLL